MRGMISSSVECSLNVNDLQELIDTGRVRDEDSGIVLCMTDAECKRAREQL
jgi:hypothetical protein